MAGDAGGTTSRAERSAAADGRPGPGWHGVALIGALFLLLFTPFLSERLHLYGEQARYSHCALLPVVSLLWIWDRWDSLRVLPRTPSVYGLALVGLSVTLFSLARLVEFNAGQHLALLGTLAGLVWGLLGLRQLRAYAFPLGYLILTLPLPKAWDDAITLPLQRIATSASEACFEAFGWVVVRQGNVLHLPGLKLLVEDACSGVHSLYALFCLSVAWAAFTERPLWLRMTLVLVAAPVALFANTIRVIGSGILAYKVDPVYAQGGSHFAAGMVVFVIGACILLGMDWCLKPDEAPLPARTGPEDGAARDPEPDAAA